MTGIALPGGGTLYGQPGVDPATAAVDTAFSTWTDFTPTLTASGGGVNLGASGLCYGYYQKVGTHVWGIGYIQFNGAGVDPGTGTYGIALPFPVAADARGTPLGTARNVYVTDTGIPFQLCALAIIESFYPASAGKAVMVQTNAVDTGFGTGANPLGAAVPTAWGGFDNISIEFDYHTT